MFIVTEYAALRLISRNEDAGDATQMSIRQILSSQSDFPQANNIKLFLLHVDLDKPCNFLSRERKYLISKVWDKTIATKVQGSN